MTEEDLEGITPEVMPSNQLSTIIKETGLEPQLADEFKINFEEHFKMASEWAKKAKKIIVTNDNQTVIMQEARTARLFLREKRLEIEKFRVSRKEYYLKGGRAIDKVANFLKDTIIPIEEHLDRQEHFVEIKKKAEDERILAEADAKQEQERIAQEEENKKHLQILKEQNERLSKQLEKDEKERQIELNKIREENNKKLLEEKMAREKVESELRAKQQSEMKLEAEKIKAIKAEERLKSAGDNEKLIAFHNAIGAIIAPDVKSPNSMRMVEDAKSHLYLAMRSIKIQQEEEI